MNSATKLYQKFVKRFPGGIQGIQTGLLMGSGDLMAQVLVERRPVEDIIVSRTLKFSLIGATFVGPTLNAWYGFLDNYFGSSGKWTALKKVACDQLLFAPTFLALFMGIVGLSKGNSTNSTEEVVLTIKNDYPTILLNNYKIWPAVQLLNFYAVPLKYQVATVQSVAVLWNTYLSWKLNKEVPERQVVSITLVRKVYKRCSQFPVKVDEKIFAEIQTLDDWVQRQNSNSFFWVSSNTEV